MRTRRPFHPVSSVRKEVFYDLGYNFKEIIFFSFKEDLGFIYY